MVTLTRTDRLTLPIAPAVAVLLGILMAATMLLLPVSFLERLVTVTGIPTVFASTEPPLSLTARITLGLILGGGLTAVIGLGLSLLLGDRAVSLYTPGALLRRSDVHPDGPPRPPLFANRDLGTPFLEVRAPVGHALPGEDQLAMTPVERDLPRDLNQPMAEFDPGALLADPLPATEAVAPLAPELRSALIDPGDRFETFELTPADRPATPSLRIEGIARPPMPAWIEPPAAKSITLDAVVAPETEATVHDLLARLERGISGRATGTAPARPISAHLPPSLPGSLAGALGDLRRLANGAY